MDPADELLRSFGRQWKIFRERAGLTQCELGKRLGYGEALIAAIEQGRRIARPDVIEKVDELLDAGGALLARKKEVALARYPAFFRDAARIEEEAVEFHDYATLVVPGMLPPRARDAARARQSRHAAPRRGAVQAQTP
ncbi:helix-turn-helix domain-containing protein [Streptomyces humicola]|uniref:helix-turn-helix domain-containing protein n=1 Tax=Streptomyces humicola TaxID=2953240 RepID=UPI0027E388F1|nr:helix-turn-helix transcriptional regulator [Streptomyces humicola]